MPSLPASSTSSATTRSHPGRRPGHLRMSNQHFRSVRPNPRRAPMPHPRFVSLALALAVCLAASPLHAVLIPDGLQEFLTSGDLVEGPVVASTPAGDVL